MAGRLNIKRAIKRPGALTRKAKAAGMEVQAFAAKVRGNPGNFSTLTVRQANFAKTLKTITNRNKGRKRGSSHTPAHARRSRSSADESRPLGNGNGNGNGGSSHNSAHPKTLRSISRR